MKHIVYMKRKITDDFRGPLSDKFDIFNTFEEALTCVEDLKDIIENYHLNYKVIEIVDFCEEDFTLKSHFFSELSNTNWSDVYMF